MWFVRYFVGNWFAVALLLFDLIFLKLDNWLFYMIIFWLVFNLICVAGSVYRLYTDFYVKPKEKELENIANLDNLDL